MHVYNNKHKNKAEASNAEKIERKENPGEIITGITNTIGIYTFLTEEPSLNKWICFFSTVCLAIVSYLPLFKKKSKTRLNQVLKLLCITIILITVAISVINNIKNINISNKALKVTALQPKYNPLSAVTKKKRTIGFYCEDMTPILDFCVFNSSDNKAYISDIDVNILAYEDFSVDDIAEHIWLNDIPTEIMSNRDSFINGDTMQENINYNYQYIYGSIYGTIGNQNIVAKLESEINDLSLPISKEDSICFRYMPDIKDSGHYTIELEIRYTEEKGEKKCKSNKVELYYIDDDIYSIIADSENSVMSLYRVSYAFYERGDYNKALEYVNKALDTYNQEGNPDESFVAMLYNSIGLVYQGLGYYEIAIEFHDKALEIIKKISDTSDSMAAISNNIGLAYSELKNNNDALNYLNDALNYLNRTMMSAGEDDYRMATIYMNIAGVYAMQCQYEMALEYLNKAFNIYENDSSTDYSYRAKIRSNIGFVYGAIGDYKDALRYYEESCEIYEKYLGTDNDKIADTWESLGTVYRELFDYKKALYYYQRTRTYYEEMYGTSWFRNRTIYNNIGIAYTELGDYDTAMICFEKATNISKKYLEKEDLNQAMIYNNMGAIYSLKGKETEAMDYFNHALAIQERAILNNELEEDDTSLGKTYQRIGTIYMMREDYQNAHYYLDKALNIFIKKYKNESSWTAETYMAIAMLYEKQGDYPNALDNSQKALQICIEKIGVNNPYTEQAMIIYESIMKKISKR